MEDIEAVNQEWEKIVREWYEEVGKLLEEGYEEWELSGPFYVIEGITPVSSKLYAPLLKEVNRLITLIEQRRFKYIKMTDRTRENLSRELGINIKRRRGRPVKAEEGVRLVRVYSQLLGTLHDRARLLVSVDMTEPFSGLEKKTRRMKEKIEEEIKREGVEKVARKYLKNSRWVDGRRKGDVTPLEFALKHKGHPHIASLIAYYATYEERRKLYDTYMEQVEEVKNGLVKKLSRNERIFLEDILIVALDRVEKPYAFLKALRNQLSFTLRK